MRVKPRRLAIRFSENLSTLRSALETVGHSPEGSIQWTQLVKRMYEVKRAKAG